MEEDDCCNVDYRKWEQYIQCQKVDLICAEDVVGVGLDNIELREQVQSHISH